MSGYISRVIANAFRPTPTIRPVVASVVGSPAYWIGRETRDLTAPRPPDFGPVAPCPGQEPDARDGLGDPTPRQAALRGPRDSPGRAASRAARVGTHLETTVVDRPASPTHSAKALAPSAPEHSASNVSDQSEARGLEAKGRGAELAPRESVTRSAGQPQPASRPRPQIEAGEGPASRPAGTVAESPPEPEQVMKKRIFSVETRLARRRPPGESSIEPALQTIEPAIRDQAAVRSRLSEPSTEASRGGTETTERVVHVTIGRVEVKAAFPLPKPQRASGQPRVPRLSLEEYLGKRSGGEK